MSISFTASQAIVLATCMAQVENPSEKELLVIRACWRFRREFENYVRARNKTGLLTEVRLYHRLLIDELNSFEFPISE